ncbi:hypothetical protein IHC78_001196 [Salmonella enterica subsp. houtenae]|nr:hypothetical protein [Salmonella enterica subsp. houtenae]
MTSEHERVVASAIQPCDDDNTSDTTVFRSVPQHWTLTPQQRAFLMLLLTMCHKNNIRLFIGVTVFINAVLLHRSNRVLSASQY